ncbi:MAG: hypothetical protein H6658_17620 [Ardenticatenaceae bacterium]|nr:hypothetical protein [Ardenticatenaceae bacterium]
MSNFEWFTDEDGDWEALSAPPPPPPASQRRWLLWLAGLLIVCLGGFLGYRQLTQRVAQASSFVTAELLSSYELRQQALASHDRELFESVLSGSNVAWMQAQQALFAEERLVNHWPLGLQPTTAVPQLLTITPAANLLAAELTVAQEYTHQQPDGTQENVLLHRTDVYRQGQQRWLYAPPTPDFWGSWLTEDGRFLSLIYPQRDQAIAQQLLTDFDNHLAAYCNLPQTHCPADPLLLVRFDTQPQSLLNLSHLPTLWQKNSLLELPAPSLIGLPIDEAGYQALLGGYSQQVVAAAIRAHSGWVCCEQGLFHQALIDKQLSQLGLKEWPLTATEYANIFQSPVAGIDQLHPFWHEPPAFPLTGNIWPQIYGSVDFVLFRKPGSAVADMQRTLLTAESYTDWLYTFTRPTISAANFQREWLHFAQSQLDDEATAVAPPTQDILLLCRANSQRTNLTTLFRYNPRTDAITTDLPRRNFLFMAPLPQANGVLLHERQVIQNRSQLLLWRDGQEVVADEHPMSVGFFHVEPRQDDLTLYGYDFAAGQSQLDLLNVPGCQTNACASQRLNGTPYWSPDGRYALLLINNEYLQLTDAQGNSLHDIGLGSTPFWLDETHYGFAHISSNLRSTPAELVVTAVSTNQPQTLLHLSELAAALPPPLRLSHLTLRAITIAPHNPDLIFIAAHVRSQSDLRTLLLTYNLQTGNVHTIYTSPHTLGFYKPLAFSPDGNWLSVTTFAHTSTLSDLFLYHIPTGQSQTLGSNHLFSALEYDWSANSQWLLRLEDSFIHLIEPATGQQKIFIHELSGCSYAAWVHSQS